MQQTCNGFGIRVLVWQTLVNCVVITHKALYATLYQNRISPNQCCSSLSCAHLKNNASLTCLPAKEVPHQNRPLKEPVDNSLRQMLAERAALHSLMTGTSLVEQKRKRLVLQKIKNVNALHTRKQYSNKSRKGSAISLVRNLLNLS